MPAHLRCYSKGRCATPSEQKNATQGATTPNFTRNKTAISTVLGLDKENTNDEDSSCGSV